jgi:hypothetical protein
MSNQFIPDPTLHKMAQAFAQAAVEFAAKHFQLTLDYSDASIQHIEIILDRFHQGLASAAPPQEKIDHYSQTFGSYIGETFRRNHAATWGIIPSGSNKVPSMRSDQTGTVFHPFTRVYKRLTEGDTEDVVVYYRYLLNELKGAPQSPPPLPTAPPPPPLPEKKSFFGRLFGK